LSIGQKIGPASISAARGVVLPLTIPELLAAGAREA
jgi:hypothetical protein